MASCSKSGPRLPLCTVSCETLPLHSQNLCKQPLLNKIITICRHVDHLWLHLNQVWIPDCSSDLSNAAGPSIAADVTLANSCIVLGLLPHICDTVSAGWALLTTLGDCLQCIRAGGLDLVICVLPAPGPLEVDHGLHHERGWLPLPRTLEGRKPQAWSSAKKGGRRQTGHCSRTHGPGRHPHYEILQYFGMHFAGTWYYTQISWCLFHTLQPTGCLIIQEAQFSLHCGVRPD